MDFVGEVDSVLRAPFYMISMTHRFDILKLKDWQTTKFNLVIASDFPSWAINFLSASQTFNVDCNLLFFEREMRKCAPCSLLAE